jgi:DNA polymerase-3 subunit epsilon
MFDRQLEDLTFIAFDTETTGLYPVANRLVEIGGVRFTVDGGEVAVFEELIDPETGIPSEAQRVNHITDDMVRGMPHVSEVLPRFLDFLGSGETILLAHNAPFDVGFIGVALLRSGLVLPPHLVFDTRLLAQALMPGLATYSLESLGRLLKVLDGQKHRALADARLTKDVFLALLARLPEVQTLAVLLNLAPPIKFEECRMYEARPPKGFEDLGIAIAEHRPVVVVYEGGTKGEGPRLVSPRSLLQYAGTVYLAGYCHIDSREKMYRLDRIRNLRLAE